MKRLVVCLLVLVLSFSLFATAIDDLSSGLYTNTRSIILPRIEFTGFHVSEVMKSQAGANAISKFLHNDITLGEFLDSLVVVLRDLSVGEDSIAHASVGFGYAKHNKALSYDASVFVDSYAEKAAVSLDSVNLNPTVLSSLSFAYAFKPWDRSNVVCNLTTIGHVNSIIKNDAVSYQSIMSEASNPISGKGGLGFPVDVRLNVNLKKSGLEFDINADNVLGYYFTKEYTNESELKKSIIALGKNVVKIPMDLNTTVKYNFDFKYVDLTLFTRFNKMNEIFEYEKNDYLRRNSDIGVQLDLLKFVQVDAGIYGGYFGTGASVNFKNNRISIRYGWRDLSAYYGQAPTDFLTVVCSLGWESNKK